MDKKKEEQKSGGPNVEPTVDPNFDPMVQGPQAQMGVTGGVTGGGTKVDAIDPNATATPMGPVPSRGGKKIEEGVQAQLTGQGEQGKSAESVDSLVQGMDPNEAEGELRAALREMDEERLNEADLKKLPQTDPRVGAAKGGKKSGSGGGKLAGAMKDMTPNDKERAIRAALTRLNEERVGQKTSGINEVSGGVSPAGTLQTRAQAGMTSPIFDEAARSETEQVMPGIDETDENPYRAQPQTAGSKKKK